MTGWTSWSGGTSSSGSFFDLPAREARLKELEAQQADPGFWSNADRARGLLQEAKTLKGLLGPAGAIGARLADARGMSELLQAEPDEALAVELVAEVESIARALEAYELKTLLREPDDAGDAILTIHPGAGGTESQDWAEMLMRMYVRWAERKGYTTSILDLLPGDEAGIKSVSIEIKGEYAYGFLKSEKGVHRLVRISPYDAQARRHTSFASVFVYPDIDDTIEVDLRDEDIKMDVYRASGAGGQHVNKTSSAVRLTHIPTGIVVACQQERSQGKNKATAYKMLRAALYQKKLEEQEAAHAVLEATKTDNSWGNQIRSYVFQPYTMVNDHRTELKVTDVQRVMDGDLDGFIQAYLKRFAGRAA
ncbi:MAG TPA: peptide chain release factor 2 [Gemmatimonadales bacterium]|jgi:peptide chain release factor 2|nr:peptide chain release factor 2 [Gemmatimonadales bacterium]